MAKDSEDIIIKVKASHVKTLFPKDGDFEKSENNFGIVVWEVVDVEDGDPKVNVRNEITVKGSYINSINWKQIYIILAKQVEHPQYGLQYEMIYYVEDIDFTKVNNQKGFLRSFLNENQISALYEKFENPLQIIANHDKQALMSIKGIGDYISNRIIRDFEEKRDMSAVFAELDGMGLTTNFINKLIANYKSPTTVIHVVLHEPYQLIDDMDGVGFVTADKIAIAGGMPIGDKKRIKAFIEYYLNQEAEAGNSYITAKELNAAIFEQLGDPDDLLEFYDENDRSKNNLNEAIQELEADKIIHMEEAEKKGARRVYLYKLWDLEREIAYHLKRIMDAPSYFVFEDFDEKIKATEERQGFEFTEEQLEGIKLGLDSQVCLITGPAGSGKSSLVSGILAVLDNYEFAQCALSGKAAARLQEVTGEAGSTIHRLLGYDIETGGFLYNKDNPLPYDIIILDEISLVGGEIFRDLLRAIKPGTKFYMLGDPNQLEAVGSLNLAADMVNSEIIPTVALKQVHRQAKKSGILTTAYDVKDQIQLFDEWDFEGTEIRGELEDMVLEITTEKEEDRELVVKYFMKYYESDLVEKDLMKIQVLSPVKERGDASVFKLNRDIQEIVNPLKWQNYVHIHKRKDAAGNDFSFDIREGDKVMCIKNSYKMWIGEGDFQTSIFNGWTGIVEGIKEGYVIVNFPLAEYPMIYIPVKEVGEYLMLGYASTIHKCVTGDTWITVRENSTYEEKVIKIRDFNPEWIEKHSHSVWNGMFFEEPDAFYVNPPIEKIISFTTEKGYSLSGLPDHKIPVWTAYDTEEDLELNNVGYGDRVQVEIKDTLFVYDTIIHTEEREPEPTYCFNMPETHTFVANNILSKNCQGSDYPVIIGVIDFTTPPSMLTHQLVYTLLTRAKKLCVLVAQSKALRKAINTDFVSTKRTFLPEMLEYSKEELLEIANINLWDEVRESYKDIEARENEPEMVVTAYTNRKVAREAENDEEEDAEEDFEAEEFDSERLDSDEAIPLDI